MPDPKDAKAARTADATRTSQFARAALMMLGSSALIAITSLLAKALGRGASGPSLHPLQITDSTIKAKKNRPALI